MNGMENVTSPWFLKSETSALAVLILAAKKLLVDQIPKMFTLIKSSYEIEMLFHSKTD